MFHGNVDMTAVLLYRMSDTPQPESVISLVLFGCHRKSSEKLQFSLHRVADGNHEKLISRIDRQIDQTFCLVRKSAHSLHRIVQRVAENRVEIHRIQKSEAFSVHHTADLDAVGLSV